MHPSKTLIHRTSLSRRRRSGTRALLGRMPLLATWFGVGAATLSAGCASTPSAHMHGGAAAPVAAQWNAPLPHGGQVSELSQWWAQFDDPLMLRLIEAGQQASPTLAEAAARIGEARAARVSSRAALMPTLDASAGSSRAKQGPGGTTPVSPADLATAGLQAGWELDLFGAVRAGANAARARLVSSQARWHEARVSVAAEVAATYVELRACEAQDRQAERDAASRARTSQLTSLAAKAGFQASAAADQASASAAQGTVLLIRQRMQCDLLIKALTALTAQDEGALRGELLNRAGRLPQPAEFVVTAMPADVLAQRPDIFAAELDVIAASADSAQARARRWPRISLAGSIGTTRLGFEGTSTTGSVWSFGPVTVTLPLLDGGASRANAKAAHARYEAVTVVYAARLRDALREVESALVTLSSAAERTEAALIAARGFESSFGAAEAGYSAGIASLFDLEDARRSMVAAQVALIELQRERVSAWIALYRALGGGWSSARVHDGPDEAPLR